ncbi:MAG: UDP-N-acetylmuramate--L-alanine ligase [Bacteroidota bacterium]
MPDLFVPGASLRVHFIGIGGISMSGLAEFLAAEGHRVSGCDRRPSRLTASLAAKGIPVAAGHDPSHLDGVDLVVYTAAIPRDAPELAAARARGIPVMERADLLGRLAARYTHRIAVAGTHGKTTTTGMLGVVLAEGGLDPTIAIGGELEQIGGNVRLGGKEIFLTEADEYVESFLRLSPTIGVILNIEPDHPDFYRDLDHLKGAFARFAALVPAGGAIVARTELPAVAEAAAAATARVIGFGQGSGADYHPRDLAFDQAGLPSFIPVAYGRSLTPIKLAVPGMHNVLNALAALAVAGILGLPHEGVASALAKYTGTKRRFEHKGVFGGAKVIDDYAHHPTEVHATLSAAKHCPHRRIWCVFQPHTYSRTRSLLDDFAKALSLADEIIVTDIYAAREIDDGRVHARDLVRRIESLGHPALYLPTFAGIVDHLAAGLRPGDLVLTMGAGDVNQIGEMLLDRAARATERR